MKKSRLFNFLFIGVLATLAVLTVIVLAENPSMQKNELPELTPTVDVPLSVTQTLQAIKAATETAKPSPTVVPPTPTIPTPTLTPVIIPNEFYIKGFQGHRQYYSIGCEASAAVDLAEFFDIAITQYDFQMSMPISDNPDLGFVGDVTSPWGQIPPYAYGVHAAPVADSLNKFGLPVEGGKDYTLDQIKQKLSENKPIIVWVIGSMVYSDPVSYTDKQGNTTIVAPYEHVVILTGYNETSVRYVSNGKWADAEYSVFLNSWAVLGNMAVMPK